MMGHIDDKDEKYQDSLNEEKIQLRQERLKVNKENVTTGEVVVEKYSESTVQEFDVPVTSENVTVERRPVEGEPLFETYNNTEDGEDDLNVIRIPVTKERLRVIKEQVVVEEIVVRKDVVEKVEHVSGTVKHDDIRVSEEKIVDDNIKEVKNVDIDK